MKKENITQIISHIDEKYIDEATVFASERNPETLAQSGTHFNRTKKSSARILRWGTMAACLTLFVIIGSVGFAIAAEATEYNNAVAFFEKNGLSAEGLSRSEVKAVYRDITQKTFSYDKTAEVIRQAVLGREIQQHNPTPEELSALWDQNVWLNSVSEKGISYRKDSKYVFDENRGFEVFEKCILECCQDGKILWTAEFKDFYVESCKYTKEGTVLWGTNAVLSSSDKVYGWIALVEGDGQIAWQERLDHGFKNEYVASILDNGDNTWAVISRGDLKYICLSCFDSDGKELSFRKTEVGNYGIRNAAKLGDGYIVQLWNQLSGDTALLYKMDREGNLTDSFSYEEDDSDYYITDMIEFEGQVYLSAYAVPIQKDEGGRYEIATILDFILSKYTLSKENGEWDISSEELTPIVRDNYTAMLLICDPEGGALKTFYSVKGSLGGNLSVNAAGELEWNVDSIITTFFSPATSSFTIGGNCAVFCYTFDSEGNLTGQTDTGNQVPYRR